MYLRPLRRLCTHFLILGLAGGALWWLLYDLPGTESRDPDHLDPAFRARLEPVLDELESRGHRPRLRSTWRSVERQRYYRTLGWSTVDWGMHCAVDAQGNPASLAADVDDHRARTDRQRADFYLALRELAPSQGLETGGTWSRRSKRWALYDLGWDPGHVQPAGLSTAAARRGERPRGW